MAQPSFTAANEQEERIRQARRRRKAWIFLWVGVGLLFVALVSYGVSVWIKQGERERENAPGTSFENQGQQHVSLGTVFQYNSNPPTSGQHYQEPANWGVYDFEIPDQVLIHNLEHGGIWISYKPGIPAAALEDLKEVIQELGGAKLIMAPRASGDTDVAVAAWQRLYKFSLSGGTVGDTEKENIRRFYRVFKNHSPENVPDSTPGIDPKSLVKP